MDLGFPWWLRVEHFLNIIFITFLVRSGLEILGVNTPFITQSSRREFMPHFGTLTASCHSVSRVVVQCYITQSSLRLFALPHSGC